MTPTNSLRFLVVSLLSLLSTPLTNMVVQTSPSPPPQKGSESQVPSVAPPSVRPTALRDAPKDLERDPDMTGTVLEAPPRALPQIMFPKNVTSAEALAPPLAGAQVVPIRPRIMDPWMDVCRGYYDVMGHFDSAFNCSKDIFIFCCGTCHYRFCCPEARRQLDQDSCRNYHSPDWAKPQTDAMILPEDLGSDPDLDPIRMQSHNTGFVIGGVVVFMVAVAVGIKIVFNKVQQEAHQRDLNMPR